MSTALSLALVAGCLFLHSLAGAQAAKAPPSKSAGAKAAAEPKASKSAAGASKKSDGKKPPAVSRAPARPVTGSAAKSSAAKSSAAKSSASGPSVAKSGMSGSTYAVKLRDLESRVDELKEQIRRSHTRLSLLSDSILSGGVGGARAEIRFKNDLSGAFRLTRALFILDGAVQYNKQDDTGGLAEQKEIPIFKGSIPPGDHTLQILLKLRGHGYGVFSYLRGYQFEVKESHSFSVTEGKEVELEVIAWEKGGVTTPLEERPAIRHLERIKNVTGPVAPPPPSEPSGATSSEN